MACEAWFRVRKNGKEAAEEDVEEFEDVEDDEVVEEDVEFEDVEDVEVEVEDDVMDDEDEDWRLVEWVVEELLEADVVDVEEVAWLVEICDWLEEEVFEGAEVRTKYPPNAATTITMTTTAKMLVLIAFRPP